MRPQAELGGPDGGADSGLILRGHPEPERPAAAGRTSPVAGSGGGGGGGRPSPGRGLRLPRGGLGGKGKEGARRNGRRAAGWRPQADRPAGGGRGCWRSLGRGLPLSGKGRGEGCVGAAVVWGTYGPLCGAGGGDQNGAGEVS